ncbi:MAG: glycosyl hydrolase 53 family protein [Flavobacteriaceae bacterium]|nr:glycosyl hydrolase 53 family protein [Flavobacteriaceae bacterium]
MKKLLIYGYLLITFGLMSCQSENSENNIPQQIEDSKVENTFLLGADLSYVNEMETCSEGFFENGLRKDTFELFAEKGARLVRVRLWHTPENVPPTFSRFSGFEDVEKTLTRAKENQMEVLLDFHYSDTWADPAKQWIPAAWKDITDFEVLKDSVYQYTLNTLLKLGDKGLIPKIVQVGNEINSEMLRQEGVPATEINWDRNREIINSGIRAVRDASAALNEDIRVMLHIAQPENAFWFFEQALGNGVTDFDLIGLSYYPLWSEVAFEDLPNTLAEIKSRFGKDFLIVETAYPFTFVNHDRQGNILGEAALVAGFEASPQGQKDFMIQLTQKVIDAGGKGLVYWEPAWISNTCETLFGNGSGWDNAAFFDGLNGNQALPVFDFFDLNNYRFKN